jgi:hypothetical protein
MNRRRRRKLVTIQSLLHDTAIVVAVVACLVFLTCAAVMPHRTRGAMVDAINAIGSM